MYIFSRTVVETVKLLCLSVACSAMFSMMIFQNDVAPIKFVCFVLNLVSLLLFLLLSLKNWQKVFMNAFTPAEYMIPASVSFFVYFAISTFMYLFASMPEMFGLTRQSTAVANVQVSFRYFFQQTRFLEPMLNKEYSFVSFALSHVLLIAVFFYVPKLVRERS